MVRLKLVLPQKSAQWGHEINYLLLCGGIFHAFSPVAECLK